MESEWETAAKCCCKQCCLHNTKSCLVLTWKTLGFWQLRNKEYRPCALAACQECSMFCLPCIARSLDLVCVDWKAKERKLLGCCKKLFWIQNICKMLCLVNLWFNDWTVILDYGNLCLMWVILYDMLLINECVVI